MAERDPGGGQENSPGVIASLRLLVANALGIVQTRLQLLANELEEERARSLQIVVLGAAAFCCAAIGILLVTAWIVIALWDQYRLLTVAVLAGLYFAAAAAALHALKSKSAQRSKLFSTSLAELRRDRDLLDS